MKRKFLKTLLTGGFYFFLIKGLLWLVVIAATALGLGKIF
tara:strand:- start:92 stop:211 length:120 start_codon:yes stop_codon:yes gene_type:complete